ncbi:hypothetical protein [Streptomyces sp. Ru73]|uniref:hypothetical protein n=1 Tax=Streptomyces sp. Ru73 TaxID=2080748 RepID=UPI0011B01D56|nr:hypothetical protein [Streptomyces sp. Ru73]
METVAWQTVWTFVIGSVERPETPRRKRTGWGPRAVRVPRGGRNDLVLAPCAYVGTAAGTGPDSATGPARPELTLYEDAAARRLLCYVEEPREADGERHHVVRDGRGEVLGTLRRLPPRRPFKHTWRLDQPGRPEITGRNAWASGSAREVAGRAAGRLATALADGLFRPGDGGDLPASPRTLEWRAADETVMVSEGSEKVSIRAEWLDRRLAFAFALVGDD